MQTGANELTKTMRGALSLAALLLCTNTPIFAKTDVIELNCKVEKGKALVRTGGSVETIDDSDRGFYIDIDKNDFTFDMIQDENNKGLVHPNKINEQGKLSEIEPNTYIFSYAKMNNLTTRDADARQTTRITEKTDLEIYFVDSEIKFHWEMVSLSTESDFYRSVKIYTGKCVRRE